MHLQSEVRNEDDGKITSRLFRKSQQKDITLHKLSHHPEAVKSSTVKNMYSEAEKLSSDKTQREHSFKILDKLLYNNGYTDPRKIYESSRKRKYTTKTVTNEEKTVLQLDFISDSISNKIRNYIKKNKLPIKVTFTPGVKLKDLICQNRPLDKRKCINNSCNACPLISKQNEDCQAKNIVYKVKCNICGEFYIGECYRCAHERLGEHLRYATYPKTPSNSDRAFAIHYNTCHENVPPDLNFEILKVENNTVRRKIFEALMIIKHKPQINTREELETIQRFLVLNS